AQADNTALKPNNNTFTAMTEPSMADDNPIRYVFIPYPFDTFEKSLINKHSQLGKPLRYLW
ncbi:MAG: hypothetical protein KAG70_06715, partial [Alcanivorax sp.]|nr:hypothetical protein [Alcanivorax sp.]